MPARPVSKRQKFWPILEYAPMETLRKEAAKDSVDTRIEALQMNLLSTFLCHFNVVENP